MGVCSRLFAPFKVCQSSNDTVLLMASGIVLFLVVSFKAICVVVVRTVVETVDFLVVDVVSVVAAVVEELVFVLDGVPIVVTNSIADDSVVVTFINSFDISIFTNA